METPTFIQKPVDIIHTQAYSRAAPQSVLFLAVPVACLPVTIYIIVRHAYLFDYLLLHFARINNTYKCTLSFH